MEMGRARAFKRIEHDAVGLRGPDHAQRPERSPADFFHRIRRERPDDFHVLIFHVGAGLVFVEKSQRDQGPFHGFRGLLPEFTLKDRGEQCAPRFETVLREVAEHGVPDIHRRVAVELDHLPDPREIVAARLEAMTKDVPGNPILINAATYEGIRHRDDLRVTDLGLLAVKGRSEPVHVYAVGGERT